MLLKLMAWLSMWIWLAISLGIGQKTPVTRDRVDQKSERQLEDVLNAWAKASQAVRDVHTVFVWTREDRTFQQKEVVHGESWARKPNLLRLEFKSDQGKLTEIIAAKGKKIRCFALNKTGEPV